MITLISKIYVIIFLLNYNINNTYRINRNIFVLMNEIYNYYFYFKFVNDCYNF